MIHKVFKVTCVLFGVLVVGLFYLVSPLDIISRSTTLVRLNQGTNNFPLEIRQWWNGSDFYSTELCHIQTNGTRFYVLVDPDSIKMWNCTLRPGELGSEVDIFHHRNKLGTYSFANYAFRLNNGVTLYAEKKPLIPH
jgi:hypothetical protein